MTLVLLVVSFCLASIRVKTASRLEKYSYLQCSIFESQRGVTLEGSQEQRAQSNRGTTRTTILL